MRAKSPGGGAVGRMRLNRFDQCCDQVLTKGCTRLHADTGDSLTR
jgi:hypothetical protein